MKVNKGMVLDDLTSQEVENSDYFHRRANLDVMLSGEKHAEYDLDGAMLNDLSGRLVTNDHIGRIPSSAMISQSESAVTDYRVQ